MFTSFNIRKTNTLVALSILIKLNRWHLFRSKHTSLYSSQGNFFKPTSFYFTSFLSISSQSFLGLWSRERCVELANTRLSQTHTVVIMELLSCDLNSSFLTDDWYLTKYRAISPPTGNLYKVWQWRKSLFSTATRLVTRKGTFCWLA